MKFVKTPRVAKKLLRKATWRFSHTDKTIYLTFDDGPTPEVTSKVLEILDQYNAKATFFCTGRKVEKHPELFDKIKENGHSVGNHTYSHLNGWKTKKEEYIKDVDLAQAHVKAALFRPPYGKIKPSQQKTLASQFKIVLWDVMSWDFDTKTSKERCLNNVLSKTQKGNIVLFHDTEEAKDNLFYSLPAFLEQFSKKGYCFNAIK